MAASCLLLLVAVSCVSAQRKIAIRAPESLAVGGGFDRIKGWSERNGVTVEIGLESAPVPAGA